ncbi:MAG: hypothetical protein D6785_12785 [Planctomycetota bacterium]|nr:MAG: hypothetical protein D6785_12785 [Planctomycetota bacterium]
MKLDGKFHKYWNTFIGALAGCLEVMKSPIDGESLLDGTGFCFRLNIHPNLKAEGLGFPWGDELGYGINRLGYACRSMKSLPSLPLHKQYCEQANHLILKGIEEGRSSIVWGVQGNFFGLVTGFDLEKKVYYVSGIRDDQDGERELPFSALESKDRPLAVYQPSKKLADYLSRESALSVFAYAVEHGMGKGALLRGYAIGLDGYDLWSKALVSDDIDPFGAAYTAKEFEEARKAIPPYLGKIKDFFPDTSFEEIIEHYTKVASCLAQVAKAFPSPFDNPELPKLSKRKELAGILLEAKIAEEKGLKGLQKLVSS